MTKWHPITCEDCGLVGYAPRRRRIGTHLVKRCKDCNGTLRYGTASQIIQHDEGRRISPVRRLGNPPIGGAWGTTEVKEHLGRHTRNKKLRRGS